MVTRWASILNPVLVNPMTNVSILLNVQLKVGANSIPHLLGQQQQGWFFVDKQAAGDAYRTAPFNDKTLTLTSTTAMTVDIGVF